MTGDQAAPVVLDKEDKQYRHELAKALQVESRDYDKTVLTLATGALAISATFAHDIAPQPAGGSTFWLGISWLLLLAAVITNLLSHATSQKALRKAMSDMDTKGTAGQHPGGWAAVLTRMLNDAAGLTLVGGMVALVWFAFTNLHATH